jgi:CPA1 family monovalent cation:H+ antiporter
LLLYGALFSGLVIALRLLWIFPGTFLANRIRTRLLHQNEPMPSRQKMFVVGWTGMRGVIALAAAIALPETLANGAPFPQRNLIIFLAFSVIFVTLVVQGLTLPLVVRILGVGGAGAANDEEESARREMLQAALAHLAEARLRDDAEFESVYDDVAGHYRQRLNALTGSHNPEDGMTPRHHEHHNRLVRDLVRVERQTAVRLRNQGQIGDETLRQLERELDLREAKPFAVN